jgi:hypothetical protein
VARDLRPQLVVRREQGLCRLTHPGSMPYR